MNDTWKLRGGTPDDGKPADELALGNLMNLGQKGKIKGGCWNCGKSGHKSEDCTAKEPDRGNKNKNKANQACHGSGNTKDCDYCGHDGHTDAECFRKPENPNYKEFKKPEGSKESSNVKIILVDVEISFGGAE